MNINEEALHNHISVNKNIVHWAIVPCEWYDLKIWRCCESQITKAFTLHFQNLFSSLCSIWIPHLAFYQYPWQGSTLLTHITDAFFYASNPGTCSVTFPSLPCSKNRALKIGWLLIYNSSHLEMNHRDAL